MWRLTLSNLRAHGSRLVLTWVSVVLGVAFVTGSLVLTDTSGQLLDAQFRTAAAGVDLTVRSTAAFNAAMGVEVQRDPLPASLSDRVAGTAGVRQVRPVASGPAQLQVHNEPVEPNGPTLLSSWGTAPYTAYSLRTGAAPRGPDEVVIDAATAREHHIGLGETVTVSATASRQLRVVGLAGVGDRDGLPNSTVVLVDLQTAQTLLGLGSRFSSLEVLAADGTTIPDLRATLAGELGRQYAVTSSQDAAAASADAAKRSIGYLRVVLLALAAAGLLVGAFLIANTFGILLSGRVRELALLRAAGATGRQVLASVLGEALLVGVTGATGGTLLGIGAAYGLRGLAQGAGLALPDGPLTVSGPTLAIALAAGTGVTLLAALGPARRAAGVAPVEAMRSAEPRATAGRRGRRITGFALLGVAATLLLASVLVRSVPGVAAGAVLLLAALGTLGPVLVPRLAHLVGRPLDAFGVPATLARESIVRNPRRTTATTLALALSLALISFVAVLGSSVKAISAAGTETISADLLVQSSRQEMLGGLSPEVATRAAHVPEVATVSRTRFGHWLDHGLTSALTAVDPHTLPRVAEARMVSGALTGLDHGGVVLAEKTARERGLDVGDTLTMTFPRDGDQRLRIVGVMADQSAQALSTSYLISLRSYAAHYTENVDATVYVALRDGVDSAAARAALGAAVTGFPNAQVLDMAEAAAGRAAAVDEVLGLITVLLGFAALIALLGITNTLALSIIERTRELGLLRAVGMTRHQLRGMVRAEAALVAAVAAVAGVALGLGLAAATLVGLASDTTAVVRVPIGPLLTVAAVAIVGGVLAGLLPARRAARLDVLSAIATE